MLLVSPIGIHSFTIQLQIMRKNCTARRKQFIHCKHIQYPSILFGNSKKTLYIPFGGFLLWFSLQTNYGSSVLSSLYHSNDDIQTDSQHIFDEKRKNGCLQCAILFPNIGIVSHNYRRSHVYVCPLIVWQRNTTSILCILISI